MRTILIDTRDIWLYGSNFFMAIIHVFMPFLWNQKCCMMNFWLKNGFLISYAFLRLSIMTQYFFLISFVLPLDGKIFFIAKKLIFLQYLFNQKCCMMNFWLKNQL